MRELLKLVVRRVVVGNLGTGNVERRLGQAAQKIYDDRSWPDALEALSDLSPERDSFETQLHRRSLNKNVLAFLRQSIVQGTVTPSLKGFLHLIMPRPSSLPYFSEDWPQFPEEQASYWASTIGNSLLVRDERRPQGTSTWEGFVEALLPLAVDNEWTDRIRQVSLWDEDAVNSMGRELAKAAASVWYD
jgi:hypothetical protein